MGREPKKEVRPDFLHIGPQRCGTTSLYRTLKGLGCVPPDVKEIQFFDKHYDLGLNWYLKHFAVLTGTTAVGEICPTYFSCQPAIDRIRYCLPDVKIVCTLRNPLSRVPSYYRLLRMYNQCPEPIELAWDTSPELRDCCKYSYRLTEWKAAFGNDGVLVLIFDDLEKDLRSYLDQFASYVGLHLPADQHQLMPGPEEEPIPRFPILSDMGARVGTGFRRRRLYRSLEFFRTLCRPFIYNIGAPKFKVEITEAFKWKVADYYKEEVDRLEMAIGRSLSSWRRS